MALETKYITDTGVLLTYWKVDSVDLAVNDLVNGLNIEMAGYPSKEIRDKGYKPADIVKLHFDDAKKLLEMKGSPIYGAIYGLVKTVDGFKEAEDV